MANLIGVLDEPAATAAKPSSRTGRRLTNDRALEAALTETTPAVPLSKRERQVLHYIIEGHTNKEIAQKLFRTQRTVEYHRNRLMRKLDTHTTAELVKRAILTGLV